MSSVELQLPSNSVLISESEMSYIDGGDAHLNMNVLYLSKTACRVKATELWATGKVKNMSIDGIAKEIFAHAVIYYAADLVDHVVDNDTIDWMLDHADPIDIADGGDTWQRQLAFEAIWGATGLVVKI